MRCFFDLSLDDLDECGCDKMADNVLDELLDVLTADPQRDQQKMVEVGLQELS